MAVSAYPNMKVDQNVVHYTIEVTEFFPGQLPSDSICKGQHESSKILQLTTLCFLTYTCSSLKEAIAAQDAEAVKRTIAADAWLYGIEKKKSFYENKQVKKLSWIEGEQVPPKKIRFGEEALWESHLSTAEKVCGGNCAADALGTQNLEIIQSVVGAIIKKGFLLPREVQERMNSFKLCSQTSSH